MSDVKDMPAAFEALDELEAVAKTPEDRAVLAEWRNQTISEREAHLAEIGDTAVPEIVRLADGSLELGEVARKDAEEGNPSGTYKGGRR